MAAANKAPAVLGAAFADAYMGLDSLTVDPNPAEEDVLDRIDHAIAYAAFAGIDRLGVVGESISICIHNANTPPR